MRDYLERVQESIASAIVTLDEAHRVVVFNRAAGELFGDLGLARTGVDFREVLGEDNAELARLITEAYARRAGTGGYDVSLHRPREGAGTMNVNVLPLFDGDGKFKGLVLVAEDITGEKRLKSAFSQYLAPAVIDRVLAHPDNLSLGGEKREVTALFTDIEGFTTLSEGVEPEELVSLLNEYFDEVCPVVLRHGGIIDKIVGDSVHVLFNTPLDQPGHAGDAVRCALELQARTEALRARDDGRAPMLGRTRIGVNTGPCVVGNFGGASRFDYTAHGDAINAASRLEGANKHLGTSVCVSAATMAHCPDTPARPIGRLVLKGKSEAIEVFEPLFGDRSQYLAQYLGAYEAMERDDPAAAGLFAALAARFPGDGLVGLHARRLSSGRVGAVIRLAHK
jgi:PAS domain S-box-containing protein